MPLLRRCCPLWPLQADKSGKISTDKLRATINVGCSAMLPLPLPLVLLRCRAS